MKYFLGNFKDSDFCFGNIVMILIILNIVCVGWGDGSDMFRCVFWIDY